ncbi:MAG: hypothetical protein LBK66_05530, partial [Spirochaetaceae bacterium]|nr:hypothetical protein [Spirochaetaceae bacterium]
GDEISLTEGITEYTITVKREGPDSISYELTQSYKFTVSYEPDLALKSIELSSAGHDEWTHTILVQDGQPLMFTVPYDSAIIAASPNNDTEVNLAANMTAGEGVLSSVGANTWALKYTGDNGQSIHSTARIISSKNVGIKLYTKTYILNIEKTVDPDYPTSYWATQTGTGNGLSIVKEDGTYYEVHTFISSGTLSFPTDDTATTEYLKTAKFDYLIVAGGGGAGGDDGSFQSDFPGGGGAGGLLYKTGQTLTLTAGSVSVMVGAGGAGGQLYKQGENGKNSGIGTTIEVTGGGGGGGGGGTHDAMTGKNGGSGGGGGAGKSGNGYYGPGGTGKNGANDIKGHNGGAGASATWNDGGGSGGGAEGPGVVGNGNGVVVAGGAPWNAANAGASWISTVTQKNEFSRGGNGGGNNGPGNLGDRAGKNYGDGGLAGNNTNQYGGAGHSGIVVIRFPAKSNPPVSDGE